MAVALKARKEGRSSSCVPWYLRAKKSLEETESIRMESINPWSYDDRESYFMKLCSRLTVLLVAFSVTGLAQEPQKPAAPAPANPPASSSPVPATNQQPATPA